MCCILSAELNSSVFDSHLLLKCGPSAGRGAREFNFSGEELLMTFSLCLQEQSALCYPCAYRGGVQVSLWSHLLLLWHLKTGRATGAVTVVGRALL